MTIRKATVGDIELLIRLRIDYLTDGGSLTPEEETAVRTQLRQYFAKHIPGGSFIAIIAETDGAAASAAYLAISEKPANPAFITGITGTLLNVYTYPEYRRKGIAAKVIEKLIGEAKQAGVSYIDLSATADGKPLYEKMGFTISSHTSMGMKLN